MFIFFQVSLQPKSKMCGFFENLKGLTTAVENTRLAYNAGTCGVWCFVVVVWLTFVTILFPRIANNNRNHQNLVFEKVKAWGRADFFFFGI